MASIKTMSFDHLVGCEVGTARLIKMIGQGSMAVVFIAYQKTLKRQIAVKILPKLLLTPRLLEMFTVEAEAAAVLAHPGIIPIYEMGESEDFLYFTMQLVKGKSLSENIRQATKNPLPSKRNLPIAVSLDIVIQVLEALNYAHEAGIVHRDIKPSNILIEAKSKRPIIADFGVARSYAGSDNNARIMVGTPTYIAPEQILNKDVDGRADLYSTGVMLFEMLCGSLPYPSFDTPISLLKLKLQLKDRLFTSTPSQLNPDIDGALEKIMLKAVAHDSIERYKTGKEFASVLRQYMADEM